MSVLSSKSRKFATTCVGMASLLGLCSCAAFTPVDVAKPSSITLVDATREIGRSLVVLKQELDRNHMRAGLLVDEVNATLKVAANAGQGGTQKLTLDAANTALAGVGLGATVTGEQTSTGNRENTISLKFKNIYTASLNAPGTASISKDDGGIEIFSCAKTGRCRSR